MSKCAFIPLNKAKQKKLAMHFLWLLKSLCLAQTVFCLPAARFIQLHSSLICSKTGPKNQ